MHRIARQKRCTSIVQRKLTKVNCNDNWGNIYVPRPGRAGPVFRLDRRRARLFRNYSDRSYTAISQPYHSSESRFTDRRTFHFCVSVTLRFFVFCDTSLKLNTSTV